MQNISTLTTPYKPVDTDLVDNLEHYAVDKIRVLVRYRESDGGENELNGLIQEVFTKDHAEFLRMEDGRTMRLDQIIEATEHQQH